MKTRVAAILLCAALITGCSVKGEPQDFSQTKNTPEYSVAPDFSTPSALPPKTPGATAAPSPALPTPSPPPETSPEGLPEGLPKESKEAEEDDTRVILAEGFYYMPLDETLKGRITGLSFPEDQKGIKIKYEDLAYIGLKHYDFDGEVHTGELIMHKKLAQEVMEIFYALYQEEYPLTSVRLVDDFGERADDNVSMAANNTSAFNYRRVAGSKTLSRHSYGAAIDINPRLNPYVQKGRISPENGTEYANRDKDFPGKIDHDDLCYKLFIQYGWEWGGDWKGDKDYQHFSKDI